MACSAIRLSIGIAALLEFVAGSLLLAAQPAAPANAPLSNELVKRAVTPTELIAIVGDETIFVADILPTIDQMLQKAMDQIPPDQLDRQRALFVQQLLPRKIEVKLVLVDFRRTIPEDKLDDVLGNIDKQVGKQFYEEQLPLLQQQFDVEFLNELDSRLRSFGTSIDGQRAEFREQMIAKTMIGQQVDRSREITHQQLLDYYREHISDYEIAARAKWEKLTALFDKFPNKAAADRALVEMGNQVLRGADFAAVAKKHSQGTHAADGGFHDWTTKGSLVSEVLDEAIFTLPLNSLSRKLEDERGFHIIRVLAREDAGQIAFEQAQKEIREELQNEDRQRQVSEYLSGLREKTYVWTLFDEHAKLARNQ